MTRNYVCTICDVISEQAEVRGVRRGDRITPDSFVCPRSEVEYSEGYVRCSRNGQRCPVYDALATKVRIDRSIPWWVSYRTPQEAGMAPK